MGMILRIASSRIVGQGDIVGRSGYFSLNLSANSVMRGRLDARRTLKSLVADLRYNINQTKYRDFAVSQRVGQNRNEISETIERVRLSSFSLNSDFQSPFLAVSDKLHIFVSGPNTKSKQTN